MLELITGDRRRLSWGERCVALTGWQRFARAFFWACGGGSAALIVSAVAHVSAAVPPVELLEPEIEHATDTYTVYRLRFAWRSSEKSCELVVYHDRLTWRLVCEPR
jgi:hypothetical protein